MPEGTLAQDDFGHMTEHSIEFQTIFLQHYLGDSFSIVPILCGGIHEFLRQEKTILTDERFVGMVDAIHKLLEGKKGNTLFVAGVDLSHIGRKFGDQLPADALLPQATAHDKTLLSLLAQGDVEKIFQNALDNQDRYRICGLPAHPSYGEPPEGKPRRHPPLRDLSGTGNTERRELCVTDFLLLMSPSGGGGGRLSPAGGESKCKNTKCD